MTIPLFPEGFSVIVRRRFHFLQEFYFSEKMHFPALCQYVTPLILSSSFILRQFDP